MSVAEPSWLARIGMALAAPRRALALAGDRRAAGRAGSDLIALIVLVVLVTQLRGLIGAAWIGATVDPGLGLRAATRLVTRALTLDLAYLAVAALVYWLTAGRRRDLGRAFDLACVAAIPLFVVDLVAAVVVRALDADVPPALGWVISSISWAWAAIVLAHAWRTPVTAAVEPAPAATVRRGRRAGWAVVALAAASAAVQVAWIARNVELVRPMTAGEPAPRVALRAIGPGGALGAVLEPAVAAAGQVVVLDFWATWCGPCLQALPRLEAFDRRADVMVVAVNLDDPAAARALFDRAGYRMALVADDGATSERFGVTTLPHTVVIDRAGVVRAVGRGRLGEVEAALGALLSKQVE